MTTKISALKTGQTHTHQFPDVREVMLELQPTEPLYLFSRDRLVRRARSFQQGFPGTLGYAVKANSEPRVIQALASQGIQDFDVASLGEVAAIARLCPAATLHFNNPVKAVEAISAAYFDYGVRSFALDEMAEFDKISKATGAARDVMCSVRFKLDHEGASYDFGSKFGATPEKAVALWRCGRQPVGVAEAYAIFGPTCDPVDRLARQVELPCSVEEGDYIEFGLMGAYASATSTGFNGFRSAAYFNVARGFPAGTRVCPC